jgi:hypothetical protein
VTYYVDEDQAVAEETSRMWTSGLWLNKVILSWTPWVLLSFGGEPDIRTEVFLAVTHTIHYPPRWSVARREAAGNESNRGQDNC